MPFSSMPPHAFQFQNACAPFLYGDALPLPGSFTPAQVEQRFSEHRVGFGHLTTALWTPALTCQRSKLPR